MRIDKWAWAVRMVKSRSKSTEMCKRGKILVNGLPVKPSTTLNIGDTVEVQYPDFRKVYEVTAFLEKRVSAPRATNFYKDISPPKDPSLTTPQAKRERGSGRPTKRDRRALMKITKAQD